MPLTRAFLDHVNDQASRLHARIVSRDHLHHAPAALSAAAIKRVKTGIRALEAYLRRVILFLALSLEHQLKPRSGTHRAPITATVRPVQPGLPRPLRMFPVEADWPEQLQALSPAPEPYCSSARTKPAAPYLARLKALKMLIEAPEKRARRLAFYLARRRPGLILAPGSGRPAIPNRYGSEISALYQALGPAIIKASRARPPPIGPLARAGPRLRRL